MKSSCCLALKKHLQCTCWGNGRREICSVMTAVILPHSQKLTLSGKLNTTQIKLDILLFAHRIYYEVTSDISRKPSTGQPSTEMSSWILSSILPSAGQSINYRSMKKQRRIVDHLKLFSQQQSCWVLAYCLLFFRGTNYVSSVVHPTESVTAFHCEESQPPICHLKTCQIALNACGFNLIKRVLC